MSFLNDLLGRKNPNLVMQPLYNAVIAEGRQLDWYEQGAVPDTLDGRFDMIAAILCAVMIRLEQAEEARQEIAWLTELFVTDMEGQLRQIGIGDLIVGKRVGEMMGALGGRLGAYRNALTGTADLAEALTRNLYRGEAPAQEALNFTTKCFSSFYDHIVKTDIGQVIAGNIARANS
ncbi:ubiquinol-cytochrome C chaperone family protein [Parasphingorhabdus cellanae]|uniref:Ubiquinol-cytochrome C chaperone n=1 Tax=Parasphingorhabdus cellanae TaxID=2806553 RepID=A0ABX7T9I5_9SPHN|nr:ubiquinol-cytochrome C chaperone family protein [Parasphingorhabdus cellanae]QTD57502.1 ubiquinol-cytochrome C chaperone [Parasphingorhabdus cellanae]